MSAGALATTPILIFDCQTTGATPESGHLLELAWAVTRPGGGDSPTVTSFLASLPNGVEIPPRISRLTGVTMEMMPDARPPAEIWSALLGDVDSMPCLAHYARFEERFLRQAHQDLGTPGPFPLNLVCTHRIACRLLPDLPRRGLRALAGYFGHPLPELKRSGDHVRATRFIWGKLVALLAEAGVISFGELSEYLDRPRPARGKRFITPLPREARLALPPGPGVYRFVNNADSVIYVGKATSLRDRVNSYYRRRKKAEKELEIVSQTIRVETTPTESSLEAALLEAEEIKRHDPPYNSALRDAGRAFGTSEEIAALAADAGYPLGRSCPMTDRVAAGTWFRLNRAMADNRLSEDLAGEVWKTLWLEPHGPGDREMLGEGIGRFLQTHGLIHGVGLARSLRVLGRDLWLEMREQQRRDREGGMAGEIEAEEPESEEPEEEETEITPEMIAGRLAGLTMSVSHQLRKGRWLALLPGAGIGWTSRGGIDRRQVTLPAAPPDTLEQYDLLRVLTTELRRLIRDGRDPEVRLEKGRGMAGSRLSAILELI